MLTFHELCRTIRSESVSAMGLELFVAMSSTVSDWKRQIQWRRSAANIGASKPLI